MSGGRFNYMDSVLKDEIFGFSDKATNRFDDWEISKLVWDVLELLHDWDWFASGDTGEEYWLEAKTAFKTKWFKTPRRDRLKKIIDETAEEYKQAMYKMIGVEVSKAEDGDDLQVPSKSVSRRLLRCSGVSVSGEDLGLGDGSGQEG